MSALGLTFASPARAAAPTVQDTDLSDCPSDTARYAEGKEFAMTSDQFATVLQWPLTQIEDWFRARSASGAVGDKDFNWLLFASTAGSRAQKEKSSRWARLALESYAALAAREASPTRVEDLNHTSMILRVWMIERLGARTDDLVQDPRIVLDWFETWLQKWLRGSAFTGAEDVARLLTASDCRSLPIEQIVYLRRLRSKLIIMDQLLKTGTIQTNAQLDDWARLRPMIP